MLQKKLNYTAQQLYEFILKATVSIHIFFQKLVKRPKNFFLKDGELTTKTGVSIKVGDVQDTPPHFIGNFTAEIEEDADINTLVLTVYAEDGDRGIPRKIAYTLEQSK